MFPATLEISARTLGLEMEEVIRMIASGRPPIDNDQSRSEVKNLFDRFKRRSLSDFARFFRLLLSKLEIREEVPVDEREGSD